MPACPDCSWREGTRCRAHEQALIELRRRLPPPPTGACTLAVVDGYLSEIVAGARVLEIGCGSWPKVRDRCAAVGAAYEGVDVQDEYYGVKSVATRLENLARLSFPDESFDLVIANQSMEHWGEHGCSPRWGLYQCFRVLRPGGRLFINVPVHFHGTTTFFMGRLVDLSRLFHHFSRTVTMEEWGNPSAPIPPYLPFADYPPLSGKPAYVLDIRALRDRPLPRREHNVFGVSGKLSRIVHRPPSFNWSLLRRKLRGLRG